MPSFGGSDWTGIGSKVTLSRVHKPYQGSCMVLASIFEFDEMILRLFSSRLFSTSSELFSDDARAGYCLGNSGGSSRSF